MGQRIIITDDNIHGATPAHDYCTVTNMSNILDDIARDLIPTGTGKPFPVVWDSDFADPNKPKQDDLLCNQWRR